MVCQYCGNQIPEGGRFCPNCGAAVSNQNSGTEYQNSYGMDSQKDSQSFGYDWNEYNQGGNGSYTYHQGSYTNTYPMNWYKFIIYFSLFFSAFINIINSFQALTGLHYGDLESARWIYSLAGGLKIVDMCMGIACLGLAIFAIFVRMQLAGFKAKGPKLLYALYGISCVVNIGYVVGVILVFGRYTDLRSMAGLIGSAAGAVFGSVLMIIINAAYFGRRSSLFINE